MLDRNKCKQYISMREQRGQGWIKRAKPMRAKRKNKTIEAIKLLRLKHKMVTTIHSQKYRRKFTNRHKTIFIVNSILLQTVCG